MNRPTVRSAVALMVLLAAAIVPGCGMSAADVAGTYELDKAAIKAAAKEAQDTDPSAAMALGMIDAMTMSLTLNADGTGMMRMEMLGESELAPAKWSLDGETITITRVAEGEAPDAKTGTVDGDTITMHREAGEEDMPFDLVFRRKKAE